MSSMTTISIISFTFFLSLPPLTYSSYNITALFAFGDSTMDAGNNNHFNTPLRSDHLPYGRDLPQHVPKGRFSNGKLSTDYLVNILGLKELLPAFLNPNVTDNDLLTGVTFGSGGSGLDNLTTAVTGVLDLAKQFELFEEVLKRLRKVMGKEKAENVINNALFVISSGTNDMMYNAYGLPTRVLQFGSVQRYQDFLLQNLLSFIQKFGLQKLYGGGARRIMVAGLPPIGFKETLKGCCGTGLLEIGPGCNKLDITCVDASKYLFWDAVHPTQSGYCFLAHNARQTVLPYVTT
ncbi:hypothetical protein TanjilG_16190 [Lupinus angustifolius]|uniref:GDSL esterase/lipase n=1 Tax=Lupinus angustifolius TaxID=3871 RepID=A0A1J7GAP1_LUPAN|nr:hypothetical protein TanjilG_16190 [Lupinus angustifolius]